MKGNWIITILIFILLISASFFVFGNSSKENNGGLPSYALINDKITEGYLFATENPEALTGVNCYCGCMKTVHGGRIHSRGLIDCFKKENGEYDSHSAGCSMCINDALEVKRMTEQNMSKEDIKRIIDNKYI